MGRNRDIYFQKHCVNAPDAKSYIEGLMKSPFRTHQRAAKEMLKLYKQLTLEEQQLLDDIKEVKNE